MSRGTRSSAKRVRTAVLLDPHPLWLEAVEEVLSRISVEVVGKTSDPKEALALVWKRRPDLLVAEVQIPDAEMDGLVCMRRTRRSHPDLRIVALAFSDDPQQIEAAFSSGAVAYVLKSAHPDDLATAVRQAFDQSIYLAAAKRGPAPVIASPNGAAGLTRRELEILRLVAEGYSNAALAKMLWVTEQTVKFHLSNIYRKLGVSNRTEASRWAQLQSILPVSPVGSAPAEGQGSTGAALQAAVAGD